MRHHAARNAAGCRTGMAGTAIYACHRLSHVIYPCHRGQSSLATRTQPWCAVYKLTKIMTHEWVQVDTWTVDQDSMQHSSARVGHCRNGGISRISERISYVLQVR